MGAYKDKNGRWYVFVRYKNWLGESSRKTKRGFTTKRDALAWERELLQKSAGSLDMTFYSFYEDIKGVMRGFSSYLQADVLRRAGLPPRQFW